MQSSTWWTEKTSLKMIKTQLSRHGNYCIIQHDHVTVNQTSFKHKNRKQTNLGFTNRALMQQAQSSTWHNAGDHALDSSKATWCPGTPGGGMRTTHPCIALPHRNPHQPTCSSIIKGHNSTGSQSTWDHILGKRAPSKWRIFPNIWKLPAGQRKAKMTML